MQNRQREGWSPSHTLFSGDCGTALPHHNHQKEMFGRRNLPTPRLGKEFASALHEFVWAAPTTLSNGILMLRCGILGAASFRALNRMPEISAELRITVLGRLSVTLGGHELPDSAWRSRQERRLLLILLAARGGRVPTERLIDWLWPDADRAAGTATLRSAVSGLRHTLEHERGARASSRYILTREGGYAWNAESGVWVDAEEFLALTDGSTQLAGSRRTQGQDQASPIGIGDRAQQIERAIALYRGDYLADEADLPWAAHTRDALRERFLSALHELAELRLAANAYEAASELARRGLEHDRLREPLYRVLMQAHARAGDVAGALQSYERCRSVLDEELGAAPSPQTRALHAAILRGLEGQGARQADQSAKRSEGDSHLRSQSPLLLASSAPFVGRSSELARLGEYIGGLDQQRGAVVAVVGEAGIGKTRLVAEALHSTVRAGSFTIAVRCVSLERGLPFAPLSEALRPLLRAVPVEALRRLPPAALAQVSDLLPVLRERWPDLPAIPHSPADGHNYLLDGLVDLALALAREQPLIVWCDDAQWADDATLAVLGRLARHAPRHALLVVLAYRSDELAENAALHELLRMLGRELLLRPLVLGRLDGAEVSQILAGLARVAPARVASLAPRLWASSGGNPLFLSVAVQSLIEAHGARSLAALLPELEAGASLPDLSSAPLLRDLVLSRAERLPEPARRLLEQLAVIGRPASLDLVEQLAGSSSLDSARLLLERQFLAEEAGERLAFSHDLVRSIIVAALTSPQRRLLHRAAAAAIAQLHGDKPERAAELAFHFEQSGHGAEEQLLRYAVAAGDHVRRSFSYRAALAHYELALRAVERLGEHAPPTIARRAFAGSLLMYEALLDWDGMTNVAAHYDRWAAGRPGLAPIVTPRRMVLLRALIGDLAGAAELSVELARRQPDAAPALDDMLWRTAIVLQPIEQEGLGIGEVASQSLIPSSTSPVAFSHAHPLPGRPADDLPAALGADEAALALFQVGWAVLMQGQLADAEPCLMRAYDLALATGQVAVAVVSALQIAHLSALRGDAGATSRWITISFDMAQQAPESAWAAIWPRIHEAFLLMLDDQHAAARDRFEQLAARLRDVPTFQSHRASVEVGLGLLDLAKGDLDRAAERLNRGLGSPQLMYGFVYVAARHGLARIAALGGDMPAARAMLAHALSYSARRSLLPEYVRTAIEIVRIERDFGDPAPALPLLRAAAELARAAGLAPLAAAAGALLSRIAS
jgi:DNA-binding SARP family transcriptional activator